MNHGIKGFGPRRFAGPAAVLTLAVMLPACRESTQAPRFHAELPPLGEPPRAITFSSESDVTPAWSLEGDSLYYSTVGLHPYPQKRGLILRIPRLGGLAEPALPVDQTQGGSRDKWLVTPTPSPDGEALAVMEIWGHKQAELCPGTVGHFCTPRTGPIPPGTPAAPTLTSVILHIRNAGTTRPLDEGFSVRVDFDGREEDSPIRPGEIVPGFPIPAGKVHRIRYHPFHQISDQEGAVFFRPSWSPDSRRVVLSDGLRLLMVDRESGEVTRVPNTEDGVFPAWSPDGTRIAFTRLVRGPAMYTTCDHIPGLFHGESVCKQLRVGWPLEGRVLMTVRPDGSGLTTLGPGEQPVWMPDSEALVFRRDDRLWLGHADATQLARPLTGTRGGSEAAVSPDGRWIAFKKESDDRAADIWVLELLP